MLIVAKKESAVVPTNDYVFKRLFGRVGNEDITKDLLSSILSDKIEKIKLDNDPILEKDLPNDKVGILDIKATLNNNISTDIEMQVIEKADMIKRILFYWSKLYTKGINSGEKYIKLNKTICILIANYELEEVREIPEYHTEWKIIETKYRKTVLTPVFEIHIISLPNLDKIGEDLNEQENKLLEWCKFIMNSNKKYEGENEMIKKAEKELNKMKQNAREERLAELRQKYIMDQDATERYGYDKGLKEGTKQSKIEISKKLLEKNIDINVIIEVTGLTEEEIKNLNN